MSEREPINLARVIAAAVDSSYESKDSDLCLLRRAGGRYEPASFVYSYNAVPLGARRANAMQRAGIDSGTATTGAPFKFTQPGKPLIQLLRQSMGAAGLATFVDRVNGPRQYPKITADALGQWVPENPVSPVSAATPTTSTLSVAFKSYIAGVPFSRQMIFNAASGDTDMAQAIEDTLLGALGAVLAIACVQGAGSASNEPLGILNHTDVGTYAMGANGAAFDINAAAAMEYTVAHANADRRDANMAWQTTPAARKKARTTARFANGSTAAGSTPLWTDADTIIGRPAFATNAAPENLTKGTSTTVCSAMIFGAWEDLLIAYFGPGIDFVVDPFSKKFQGMIEVAAFMNVDVGLKHPESFCIATDLLTT